MCTDCEEHESPYRRFLSLADREAMLAYVSSMRPPTPDPTPRLLQDLPTELRDNVFDHSLRQEEDAVVLDRQPRVHIRDDNVMGDAASQELEGEMEVDHGPLPVNRSPSALRAGLSHSPDPVLMEALHHTRMQSDYSDRARRRRTLIIKDSDMFDFHKVAVPKYAMDVRWLVCYLVCFCHSCIFLTHDSEQTCRATSEIASHKTWIEDLLQQLKQLRAFTILLHLAHHDCVPGQTGKLPCEELLGRKLEALKELPKLQKLVVYRYRYQGAEDFGGEKDFLSEWQPELADRVARADFK